MIGPMLVVENEQKNKQKQKLDLEMLMIFELIIML